MPKKNMAQSIECADDLNRDVSERDGLISDLSHHLQQAEQEINFQEKDIGCLNNKVNTLTNGLNDATKIFRKDL